MYLITITTEPMKMTVASHHAQQGAFLLEALIGILIFSLGILGIVGLQAQAMRFTNDAEYRAEAVYLANSLISQMWADKQSTLKANYDSSVPGLKYPQFVTDVHNGMPGAILTTPPVVRVDVTDGSMPLAATKTSSVVSVQISWTVPGDTTVHNYTTTGVIGQN